MFSIYNFKNCINKRFNEFLSWILVFLIYCNILRNAKNVSLEKNGSDRILGQRPSFETVTRIHPFHDLREDWRKKRGEERRSTPLHENPLCDEQWPRPTDWQIHPYFLSVSFRLIARRFFFFFPLFIKVSPSYSPPPFPPHSSIFCIVLYFARKNKMKKERNY